MEYTIPQNSRTWIRKLDGRCACPVPGGFCIFSSCLFRYLITIKSGDCYADYRPTLHSTFSIDYGKLSLARERGWIAPSKTQPPNLLNKKITISIEPNRNIFNSSRPICVSRCAPIKNIGFFNVTWRRKFRKMIRPNLFIGRYLTENICIAFWNNCPRRRSSIRLGMALWSPGSWSGTEKHYG